MVAIIDYDAGNVKSVENAMKFLGQEPELTRDPDTILKADHIILPGVGAFGDAMGRLASYRLIPVIRTAVERRIPFLGICLGLQLMFEDSEESPGVKGLSLLPGHIKKLPSEDEEGTHCKVPEIGWNDLSYNTPGRLFEGIPEHSYVYFVHSYYLKAGDPQIVTARTHYTAWIDASVEKNNLFACQFHPEKSEKTGRRILENFLAVR